MNVGKAAAGAAGMMDKLGLTKELSKVMSAAETGSGLDNSLKSLTKMLEDAFGDTAGQGAGGGSVMRNPGMVEKFMYLSVLRGAMQKAAESKHFNLETQMNDLWVKLSQVRQQKSGGGMEKFQQLVEKQAQLQQTLANVLKTYHYAAKSVIQNMR